MVPSIRKAFNNSFTIEKYETFLKDLHSKHPGDIEFRVSETPVFVDKAFKQKMLDACERIVDVICDEKFLSMTERAIPPGEKVPNENKQAHMIAFDFGVCINDAGELEPQLIEMQGFPTLFGFQVYYPEVVERHFPVPSDYSQYLNGYTKETYIEMLRMLIVGGHKTENVVLLEIKPEEQKTRIDFSCTKDYIGIEAVCLTKLIQEGKKLYYLKDGIKTEIKRIYNRIIFDDLKANKEKLGDVVDITQELDVEWLPHPNWFYRISKFTLPFIDHPYVPETFFLNEIKQLPNDLSDYVLKPLFSFAGQGVIIDVTQEDIDAINDPENFILQRKVQYADVVETPDDAAKVEIRMMYVWPDADERPHAAINLARMSKGKMIGVRYNKDKTWVGGSVAFMEK
ncbi:MAG: circularly permuted type 2 ATP-grasp protein [Chitinophagaceae bacterium]|nr:circularly permuted type 2 ATP-grasp protein [Chitinophagaceae bacterium]